MRQSNSFNLFIALAVTATFSVACGDNSELSPEIVSCADSALTILVDDDWYQVCETTGVQPGPGSIGTVELQIQADDETDNYTLPFDFSFYGTVFDEVSVDTNGHIWMGDGVDSSYDIDLPLAGADGVIAAWNTDLDSSSHGRGARVSSFDEPNRVVFDWHTETNEDEGEDILNRFQIVLYETGEILFHYFYFNNSASCDDNGSGISVGDDSEYIDLSDALNADVCDVADQRSFMFEPLPPM